MRNKNDDTLNADSPLGVWLVNLAAQHNVSITKIARAVGASRQTIYNWGHGRQMLSVFQPRVQKIVSILKNTKPEEEAWRKICQAFDLSF